MYYYCRGAYPMNQRGFSNSESTLSTFVRLLLVNALVNANNHNNLQSEMVDTIHLFFVKLRIVHCYNFWFTTLTLLFFHHKSIISLMWAQCPAMASPGTAVAGGVFGHWAIWEIHTSEIGSYLEPKSIILGVEWSRQTWKMGFGNLIFHHILSTNNLPLFGFRTRSQVLKIGWDRETGNLISHSHASSSLRPWQSLSG